MLRLALLLIQTLALLGAINSVQGQSQLLEIEPASPQLELSPTEDQGDDDDLLDLDPANADDNDDDDLDLESEIDDDENSDLDGREEPIETEQSSDEMIGDNWPANSINEIELRVVEVERVPEDRSELLAGFGRVGPVSDSVKVFAWEAANIRYQPLYFEDVVLERYGQTMPDYRQGFRSAAHFALSFTGLSLQLLETPPKSCDYPLGYCRPGTCVPQTRQRHFFGALSLQ